jgi:hypothetical protein
MTADRRTAIVVGALFITATVTAAAVAVLWGPVLTASDPLLEASQNASALQVGALLELIAALAVVAIPVAVYPVLRRHDHALAVGYVAARTVEGVFLVAGVISVLVLLTMADAGAEVAVAEAGAGLPDTMIVALGDWAGYVASPLFLCVGALAFYSVLFRARLVPRWLSGASLLTALLYLPTVALAIIGVVGPDGTTPELMVLAAPFALMEMVLALWLIAKGFETPIASD